MVYKNINCIKIDIFEKIIFLTKFYFFSGLQKKLSIFILRVFFKSQKNLVQKKKKLKNIL